MASTDDPYSAKVFDASIDGRMSRLPVGLFGPDRTSSSHSAVSSRENKLGAGKFTRDLPQMYAQRAAQLRGKSEYQNYMNYLIIFVAPEEFRERCPDQAVIFDKFMSHESMAEQPPEFAQ